MIRPLRRAHRWLFVTLAVVLPAVFVAGLVTRPSLPPATAPVAALRTPDPDALTLGIGIAYIGQELTAKIGDDAAGGRFLVVTKASAGSVAPDLHLYWTPSDEAVPAPGEDSYHIGTFGEREVEVFPLPDAVRPNQGQLVLFSLAHGRVVESAPFTLR